MKNSQRTGVRQYHKSDHPRLRWTPDLHEHFVEVVQSLGGKHKATPKRILQMMRVRGLKISHIKSHLQMYRNTRGHAIIAPVDELLKGKADANDLQICSICSPQRSRVLEVSKYDSNIIKRELHLLDNKGLSQTSEETDYDLNQEPYTTSAACLVSDMSNEEENYGGTIPFGDKLSLSFDQTTHLFPTKMMHSGQGYQRILSLSSNSADDYDHFVSSPNSAYGHDHVDHNSSSTQSLGRKNYINLDLTI